MAPPPQTYWRILTKGLHLTSETISDSAECNLQLDRVVTQVLTPAVLSLGSQPDLFPNEEYERTKTW